MLRTPSAGLLYGLVDMGSNGIRFSITDLSPSSARSLPTVFQDREGISLFDAQYAMGVKGPIPQDTIDAVIASMVKFQTACADFGVPDTNIRVLATEATRNAVNAADFLRQIKSATAWDVSVLPKEVEGRIGAMGVASSCANVQGLVMDLGGGSTQITWMVAKDGHVQMSAKGAISFPYGAAALTRQLAELPDQSISQGGTPRSQLADQMKTQFRQAYRDLELPESLQYQAQHGGLTLYLSGGGFRGWGYLLMSVHKVSPYPIPIINGFQVAKREFLQTAEVSAVAAEQSVFRISSRRAAQVPAVAFLVSAMVDALPMIQQVRFCQGGVREGFLWDTFDTATKALDPLSAATARYGTSSAAAIADLLGSALPGANHLDRSVPATFTPALVRAVADLMYLQLPAPKESRSLSALHAPLTGVLTSAHGLSHADRALLALTLARRWDGDLPPPHDLLQTRLRATLTQQEAFWAHYLGGVAAMVGSIYPAGIVDARRPRIRLAAHWADGLGKKGLAQGVVLELVCRPDDGMTSPAALTSLVNELEKMGKKKHRICGEMGFGVPVRVDIERTLS